MLSRNAANAAARVLELVAEAGDKTVADLKQNPDMLVKHAGLDSLDSVELTMEFEEVFKIEIADDEAGKIKTVRDLQLLVAKKVDAATPQKQKAA